MKPTNRSLFLAVVMAASVALATEAAAISNGIWHYARPGSGGCGNCHGPGNEVLPPGGVPVPVIGVDGLPENYTPGETYALTVYVLGPVLPFAGFNLEATGGNLRSVQPTVPEAGVARVGEKVDECKALQMAGTCSGGSDCQVATEPSCPMFGPEYPDCACAPADRGDPTRCRACDRDRVVSIQARHTQPATVPMWSLDWTAPSCGFGDVKFYLAGNSVNYVFTDADEADLPALWPEPEVASPVGCP